MTPHANLVLLLVIFCANVETTTLTVGGLFPVTSTTGALDAAGIERFAAFRMAVADLNANRVVPNVTFSFKMANSMRDAGKGIFAALDVADTVAVVGAASSAETVNAAYVLSGLNVPQISYSATTPTLSDKTSFKTFSRTVPPDSLQGAAMIALCKVWGWQKAVVISDSSSYGTAGAASIVTASRVTGSTVTVGSVSSYSIGVSVADAAALLREVLASGILVVLFFGDGLDLVTFLDAVSTTSGASRLIFVVSDSSAQDAKLAALQLPANKRILDAAQGCVGLRPTFSSTAVFTDFYRRWLARPTESFQYGFNSTSSINTYAPYAYDAVYAIGYALRTNSSLRGDALLSAIRGLTFEGVTGTVAFDASGDRKGSLYEIVNLRESKWVPVGTWDNLAGFKSNNASIVWPGNSTVVPQDSNCVPGTWKTDSHTCAACNYGEYSAGRDATGCTACAAGKFNPNTGQSTCTDCPVGTFSYSGSVTCDLCQRGYYQPRNGSAECVACPKGSTTILIGASSVTQCQCEDGFFNPEGRPGEPCYVCPANTVCKDGLAPSIQVGFYANTAFLNQPVSARDVHACDSSNSSLCLSWIDNVVFECKKEEYCTGCEEEEAGAGGEHRSASATRTSAVRRRRSSAVSAAVEEGILECRRHTGHLCSPSHAGRMCSSCNEGYFAFGGRCLQCPKKHSSRVAMTVLGMVAVIVVWFLVNRYAVGMFDALDLSLIAVQQFAFVVEYKLRWSELAEEFLGFLTLLTFDVDFLSPECLGSYGFQFSFYAQLLLPVFVAAGLSLVTLFALLRSRLPKDSVLGLGERHVHHAVHVRDKCIKGFFGFMIVSYPVLGLKTLIPFNCTSSADGARYLVHAPQIECLSSDHIKMLVVAIISAVVYLIGIPATIVSVVRYGTKHDLLSREWFLAKFGAMYERYETSWQFWEILLLSRRLGFVVILVFFPYYPVLQGVLGCSLCAIAIGLHFFARPFIDTSVDLLDAIGCLATFFLIVLGLLFYNSNSHQSVSLSTLVIIVVCIAVLVAIFVTASSIRSKHISHTVTSLFKAQIRGDVGTPASRVKAEVELCETIEPEYLDFFSSSVKKATADEREERIAAFRNLNKKLLNFISDDSITSVYSRDRIAKFYRAVCHEGCAHFIIDALVLSPSLRKEMRTCFGNFKMFMQSRKYSKMIVEKDVTSIVHWLLFHATNKDVELYRGVMDSMLDAGPDDTELLEDVVSNGSEKGMETPKFLQVHPPLVPDLLASLALSPSPASLQSRIYDTIFDISLSRPVTPLNSVTQVPFSADLFFDTSVRNWDHVM